MPSCKWIASGRMAYRCWSCTCRGEYSFAPLYPFGQSTPAKQVSYAIDGEWRAASAWDPSEHDDSDLDGAFAGLTQARDITCGMLAGASAPDVRVEGYSDRHFSFRTQEFSKA